MKLKALACLFVSLLAVSCGEEKTQVERPLSSSEAAVLAEVLWQNYELGGAQFRLSAKAGFEGGTITLEGVIDWSQHQGHALVFGGAQPNPVEEVWWEDTAVAEWRPDLAVEIDGMITGERRPVVVRDPDLENRRLDQLLAVVTGLASENPENAQLILQAEGSAFIRTDVLREQPVVLLRYGQRSIYWINVESGEMMRFEGVNTTGQFPVIVDILEHGPQAVGIPVDVDVIDLASNSELFNFMPTSP